MVVRIVTIHHCASSPNPTHQGWSSASEKTAATALPPFFFLCGVSHSVQFDFDCAVSCTSRFSHIFFPCRFVMPFSEEDKVLIKHYRLDKGYGARRILSEFPNKDWTLGALSYLITKIDETSTTERREGSGRPRTVRTEENIQFVLERTVSQPGQSGTHSTPNQLAQEMGVSDTSVRRIIRDDLHLRNYRRMQGQKLDALDHDRRVDCARKMIRRFTLPQIGRIFFTDEKIFRIDPPWNSQNDRVYAPADGKKADVSDERLFVQRGHFSPGIMVSAGVSKLGRTSLHFVDPEAKVNGEYYREHILSVMLPECAQLAGAGGYTFQQDGARAHTARDTITFLEERVPGFIEPAMWPPNSPDLNPMDYSIWGILQGMVYREKIRNRDHLQATLLACWDEISQDHINSAIDQFRPRLRKLIEVEGKHIEQFF